MTDKLAKQTDNQFGILAVPEAAAQIAAAMAENMGGELNTFDMPSIPMPAGSSSSFEVPSLDGDVPVKELRAVILVAQAQRRYYTKTYEETGGEEPPDCFSPDGVTGYGTPGGSCSACAFSKFNTAAGGRGCACPERKQLILLTEISQMPYRMSVPPTSLASWTPYTYMLSGAGMVYYGCVTRLSLTEAKNAGGIKYPKLKFAFERALTEEEAAVSRQYRETLLKVLASAAVPAPAAG